MKMFRKIGLTLLLCLYVSTAAFFAGCRPSGLPEEAEGKSILRVQSFSGGTGEIWLKNAIVRFEERFKDVSFEDGKTGVYVVANFNKEIGGAIMNKMASSPQNIFITEGVAYYDFIAQNLVADITDIVEEKLTLYGEERSIADKLAPSVGGYFKTAADGTAKGGKYFGLPHYEAYEGITYDIDLFEKEQMFLKGDPQNGYRAIKDGGSYVFGGILADDDLSSGPDGLRGTNDDGLPATYDQFFALCAYMKGEYGIMPFLWTNYTWYLEQLLIALHADYEGAEDMLLNSSVSGRAHNIVTDISGGNVQTTELDITNANGYELYKQAGRYYALDFLERILDNGYVSSLSFSTQTNHTGAQVEYLYSVPDTARQDIAMLVEGTWWENEADEVGVFSNIMQAHGSAYSRFERNLGFLPFQKVSEADIGKPATLLATNRTAAFINANCSPDMLALSKKFFQFLYTDEEMKNFTKQNGNPLLLDYAMAESDLEGLSRLSKSVWDLKKNSTVIYPASQAPLFLSAPAFFDSQNAWPATLSGGSETHPVTAIREKNVSAADYFNGMYAYRKPLWETTFAKYL